MKRAFKTKGQLVLAILILAALLFIFIHSLIPPGASSEESEAVAGFLDVIFPSDTAFGSFVQNHVRKIAHFSEFAVLGVLTSLYTVLYLFGRKYKILNAFLGLPVGFIDESLQYLSGRGPAISDVWLDFLGFAFGVLVIYACSMALAQRSKKE